RDDLKSNIQGSVIRPYRHMGDGRDTPAPTPTIDSLRSQLLQRCEQLRWIDLGHIDSGLDRGCGNLATELCDGARRSARARNIARAYLLNPLERRIAHRDQPLGLDLVVGALDRGV